MEKVAQQSADRHPASLPPLMGSFHSRECVTAGTPLSSGALLSRTIAVLKAGADTNIDLEGRAWLL